MKTTVKLITASAAIASALTFSFTPAPRAADAKPAKQPIVQLAILLDTSGFVQPTILGPDNVRIVQQSPERNQYVIRK